MCMKKVLNHVEMGNGVHGAKLGMRSSERGNDIDNLSWYRYSYDRNGELDVVDIDISFDIDF
jgi:hypothetical protein